MISRLLLFIFGIVFSFHAWAYAYDANTVISNYKETEFRVQNNNYDGTPSLCFSGEQCTYRDLQKKAQDGSFFAFEVGLFASRGGLTSETRGAVTNLGSRSTATNAEVFGKASDGMSGVFDHATGRFILRPSTNAWPLPSGSVARFGGHSAVRNDLGAALGENLSAASSGRLSGFSMTRDGAGVRFGWNSRQINPGSHGSRGVPAGLRAEIESAVRQALGL